MSSLVNEEKFDDNNPVHNKDNVKSSKFMDNRSLFEKYDELLAEHPLLINGIQSVIISTLAVLTSQVINFVQYATRARAEEGGSMIRLLATEIYDLYFEVVQRDNNTTKMTNILTLGIDWKEILVMGLINFFYITPVLYYLNLAVLPKLEVFLRENYDKIVSWKDQKVMSDNIDVKESSGKAKVTSKNADVSVTSTLNRTTSNRFITPVTVTSDQSLARGRQEENILYGKLLFDQFIFSPVFTAGIIALRYLLLNSALLSSPTIRDAASAAASATTAKILNQDASTWRAGISAVLTLLRNVLPKTMIYSWAFWFPMRFMMLKYIPTIYHLLAGNLAGYVWSTILTIVLKK